MKKTVSLLLAILLLSLLLCPAALAEEETVLRVTVPDALPTSGETVTVTVEIENNPGFSALQFALQYDTTAFSCVGITTGALVEGALCVTNPSGEQGAAVVAVSVAPITGDGTVARAQLRALKAVSGWEFALQNLTLAGEDGMDIPYRVEIVAAAGQTPEPPEEPVLPDDPETPEDPVTPETPDEPDIPGEPENPAEPTLPDEPETPVESEPEEAPAFPDTETHWSRTYVAEAARRGIFNGYPDGSFHPDENITRAQFVTVVWRMAGRPEPAAEAPFTDLDGLSDEFRTAIAWAAENGVVNGRGEGCFDPSASLKREEAMTILFRSSGGMSGMEMLFTAIYDAAYQDSGEISMWARPAMYWAVYKELITGTSADTLSPQKTATRAEIAKILVNYQDNI